MNWSLATVLKEQKRSTLIFTLNKKDNDEYLLEIRNFFQTECRLHFANTGTFTVTLFLVGNILDFSVSLILQHSAKQSVPLREMNGTLNIGIRIHPASRARISDSGNLIRHFQLNNCAHIETHTNA